MIANKLKNILPTFIGESQSAFVLGKLLTNNASIAFETFYFLKIKKNGRERVLWHWSWMSKAYDWVQWRSLNQVLISMSLPDTFISLIIRYVTSVLLYPNKWRSRSMFYSMRSLRKGNPLSPNSLFNMLRCFHAWLIVHKVLKWDKLRRRSHIFFADDNIIFFRASIEEANIVYDIIHSYKKASEQRVNLDKMDLSLSQNVLDSVKTMIQQRIGVTILESPHKYFGQATLIDKSKGGFRKFTGLSLQKSKWLKRKFPIPRC